MMISTATTTTTFNLPPAYDYFSNKSSDFRDVTFESPFGAHVEKSFGFPKK